MIPFNLSSPAIFGSPTLLSYTTLTSVISSAHSSFEFQYACAITKSRVLNIAAASVLKIEQRVSGYPISGGRYLLASDQNKKERQCLFVGLSLEDNLRGEYWTVWTCFVVSLRVFFLFKSAWQFAAIARPPHRKPLTNCGAVW